MPTAKEWAEGFGLELDRSWEEEKDSNGIYGYRPCSYYAVKEVGFELDITSREDEPIPLNEALANCREMDNEMKLKRG